MSFLLRVDKNGAKYAPTHMVRPIPVYVDEKKQKILVGYVYRGKESDVLDCGWEKDPTALQAYDGSMALISWAGGGKVTLCYDMQGSEKVYYYRGDHMMLVSDCFWDIVSELQPAFSDLDKESVRERLVVGNSFMNRGTIIKNLSRLLPASIVTYDVANDALSERFYQTYNFAGELTDMDSLVEQMDKAMDATMQSIKERYGDVTYGLGLSGGLDSRLALHYAVKNGLRVHCFNVCKKRPNGVLLARSVRLAKKLADIYSVPLTLVEWDPKQIDKCKAAQLRHYPDGPLQEASRDIYKYIPDWKPDFQVLLSGGTGTAIRMFAEHYPSDILSSEDAAHYVEECMLYHGYYGNLTAGMHALFKTPLKEEESKYPWEERLFEEPKKAVHARLVTAFQDLTDAGIQRFNRQFFNQKNLYLSSCDSTGAFEAMFERMPAHTIYSSFVLKQGLRCNFDLLHNRGITRALICAKAPKASMIPEENHSAAPAKINSFKFLRKGFALFDRLLRGDGSHVASKYWRTPEVWQSFEEDMENDCKWFWNIFGKDIPLDEVKKTSDIKMSSIWDTKRILDALETKSYKSTDKTILGN